MAYEASTQIRRTLEEKNRHFFHFDKASCRHIQDCSAFEEDNSLFALVLLPADGIPVRCFSSYISILFCQGDATVFIGSHKTVCFAGNIFLLRQKCDFIVEPKAGSEVYLALYKEELFDALFLSQIADCPIIYDFFLLKNCHNEFLYFDCNNEMPIYHFARALQLELCGSDTMSDKTVRCATVLFLSNLHRIYRTNLVVTESSMMKKYVIGSILKYMADNYTTATLSSTAAYFNYHPAYLSTLFQKKAFCSFTKKMQEIRLEQARRMLVSTRFTIQQICENIGFREKSYFYRCFKAAYGVTPGQYRKINK